jgi:hypothetical protein
MRADGGQISGCSQQTQWRALYPERAVNHSQISLLLSRSPRDVKFNAICGVDLLCRGSVKVGKLVFMRVLLAKDPQSLAGDSVAFGRDAVTIAEDKYRGDGWFLCG